MSRALGWRCSLNISSNRPFSLLLVYVASKLHRPTLRLFISLCVFFFFPASCEDLIPFSSQFCFQTRWHTHTHTPVGFWHWFLRHKRQNQKCPVWLSSGVACFFVLFFLAACSAWLSDHPQYSFQDPRRVAESRPGRCCRLALEASRCPCG